MIQGEVNVAYEPVVSLAVQGLLGRIADIEAVIDTGFSEFLTLPPDLLTELRLSAVTSASATLADGSEVAFDVYEVTVLWDGLPRRIYAYMSDTTPLIGMRLLDGYNLNIQVKSGGRVAIQPIE